MVKSILQIGDPSLFQISKEINLKELGRKHYQTVIKDLVDTAIANKDDAAGLSGVQIGYLDRIFVFDIYADYPDKQTLKKWEIVINPSIVSVSSEPSTVWEGCMSISSGDMRLYGPVSRPNKVEIHYFDKHGKGKNFISEGFMSHLILHEMDHLDGILFLKYVPKLENIWKADALDKYYQDNKKYPPVQ